MAVAVTRSRQAPLATAPSGPWARGRAAGGARARVPLAVLGVALAPSLLDLLHLLLRESALAAAAGAASAAAALALVAVLLRGPRTTSVAAAMVAFEVSVLARSAGIAWAPLLALLAVVALGVGGAFRPDARAEGLLAPAAGAEEAPASTAAPTPPPPPLRAAGV